jgi:hypothetical protein
MALKCLRCEEDLSQYRLVALEAPLDSSPDSFKVMHRALVICENCGSCELFKPDSPLLNAMFRLPTGD